MTSWRAPSTTPRYPVPGSFGFVTTDAWGPFVVAPGRPRRRRRGSRQPTSSRPRSSSDAPDRRGRRACAPGSTTRRRSLTQDRRRYRAVRCTSARRWRPRSTSAQGNLAVTRVSLVIVGLMLVVLAVTVLLLAARLLADRRAPEQTLMSSRGASGGQLLGLAALEAAAVALVTTLVSPWLAGLLFQAITAVGPLARRRSARTTRAARRRCGSRAPSRRSCWPASCSARSCAAGAASSTPSSSSSARTGAAGSHAPAPTSRWSLLAGRRRVAAARRTGRPCCAGPRQLDPLLVAAPALLLLAGAVLALRLLPAGRARWASGSRPASRSLVAPLAAWEVGRRPGRAAGAVLLLTLALAVGSFSQSFLSTWRTSQARPGRPRRSAPTCGSDRVDGSAHRAGGDRRRPVGRRRPRAP